MRGVATVCLVALVSMAQEAPDPRFPKTMKEWTPASLINPDELGELYEGDIEPPVPSWEERSGLVDLEFKWPKGEVPYEIDSGFSESALGVLKIAMEEFEIKTNSCIKWVKRHREVDYVKFINNSERCSTSVGKTGEMQPIFLTFQCFQLFGSVVHVMMHALGIIHEHERNDRDDYITIMWRNIIRDQWFTFFKYPEDMANTFDVPYNYYSVMHYSAYAFTNNKEKTIVPKNPDAVIGQRTGLSDSDIRKLKAMYC